MIAEPLAQVIRNICCNLSSITELSRQRVLTFSVLIWPRTTLHPSLHFRGKPSHATGSDATPIREQVASDVPVDRGARQAGLKGDGPETPKLVIIRVGARFVRRRCSSIGLHAL